MKNSKWPNLIRYGEYRLLNPNGNKHMTILSDEVLNKELRPVTNSKAEKPIVCLLERYFSNLRESKDGRYLIGVVAFRVFDRSKNYDFIVTKDGKVKDQNRYIVESRWGEPLQFEDLEILVVGDNGDLAIIDIDGVAWSREWVKYRDGNYEPI